MKGMYSLTEMAAELERQHEAKVDYLADTRRIHFTTPDGDSPSELDLLADGGEPVAVGLRVNEVAHGQISNHLGIPKRYYDRLRGELPVLLDENVNRLLRHQPTSRMIRTLDGTARAFLSDAYRRIDNYDIASTIIPILGELPEVQFKSCALTDTNMYVKAITPSVSGEVKVGDEVCAGVVVRNSEVGRGSFSVEPMVFRLVCSNGMIAGTSLMKRIHVGRRVESDELGRILRDETVAADDRAFMLAVGDVVRAAVDEVRFRELLDGMRAAAEGSRVEDPVAAVEVLARRESLGEGESRSVLRHLAEGGDLSRWGVLNAVTRAAQDVEDYDRSTELEEIGGRILAMSPTDWRPLAEATV